MEREGAIALLKEILAEQAVVPIWVDLEQISSDWYELDIKPLCVNLDSLKRIVEKHNFAFKEAEGRLVIYEEQNESAIAINH
jgi:hypothetical protein